MQRTIISLCVEAACQSIGVKWRNAQVIAAWNSGKYKRMR